MDRHCECTEVVTMPREEFRELLEEAARQGAEKALIEAGVSDAVKLARRVDGISDAFWRAFIGLLVVGLGTALWQGMKAVATLKTGGS